MTQTGVESSRAGKVVRGQAARRRPPPPAAGLGAAISSSTWKCLARYILLVGLFSDEHSDEALAEALEDEAEAAAAIPVLISQDVIMIRFMVISSFTAAIPVLKSQDVIMIRFMVISSFTAAIPVLISQDVIMIRFMVISSFTVVHEKTSNTHAVTSHDFKSRKAS
jgi:hypothetical protein